MSLAEAKYVVVVGCCARILWMKSQVLGGNYSSTKQVNSIQRLIAYCLLTWTKVDIREIIYNDLKEKKKKSQALSQPKPKTQGPMASETLPQKRKQPKTQKTPVVQATKTPPIEKVPTKVSNDSNCCSSCLKCLKDLKEKNKKLVKDLRTARINAVSYKTGLESVKARLLVFKKNEFVYEKDIKLLKREIYLRDSDITELKRKLELATKEKDEVQLTIQKFENSSKSLNKLLDSQIMDKCKTKLGYNVVPPPYTENFMPPKPDLVYPSLDDFVDVKESVSETVVEKPNVESNEPKTIRK
nr:hypothetical protein [Tanacetum cinerariifolium]